MMEGYDPQVFTKRFNAEVENMEPALNALETAEEVVRESEDHRFESVGFNMNVGYDHLDGAYDILKDTANAELTYEYLPEDQNAVLLVTRNGISSQRHKGNPGGWDTELAEKVKRRFQ